MLLGACGASRPPAATTLAQQSDPITSSLFNATDRTISEEDIRRLLDGRIRIPDSARVAVYNLGNSLNKYYSGYGYNEEYLKLRQQYIDTLTTMLQRSDRIVKTMLMPSILTPRDPTLTNLRESAVRLQADILLIFHITSDIYYNYKLFKKDEAKAFATIETVLLDIRTGVVPHSNIITREKLIVKDRADMDVRETQKRAEQEAVLMALNESGRVVVEYLRSISQ